MENFENKQDQYKQYDQDEKLTLEIVDTEAHMQGDSLLPQINQQSIEGNNKKSFYFEDIDQKQKNQQNIGISYEQADNNKKQNEITLKKQKSMDTKNLNKRQAKNLAGIGSIKLALTNQNLKKHEKLIEEIIKNSSAVDSDNKIQKEEELQKKRSLERATTINMTKNAIKTIKSQRTQVSYFKQNSSVQDQNKVVPFHQNQSDANNLKQNDYQSQNGANFNMELALNKVIDVPQYYQLIKKVRSTTDSTVICLLISAKYFDYKILRMIFIIRFMDLAAIYQELEMRFQFRERIQALSTLLKLIMLLIFFAHFIACAWHLLGRVEFNNNLYTLDRIWMQNIFDDHWYNRYITSFYWTIITMITVGYGDVIPKNPLEQVFVIFVVLVSGMLFAYTMNYIGETIKELSKKDREFKQQMVSLNFFLENRSVNQDLKTKIIKYFEYLRKEKNEDDELGSQLINTTLSESLRQEVMKDIYGSIIRKKKLFKILFSHEFLNELALKVKEKTIGPEETIFKEREDATDIYFIMKGEVEICVNLPENSQKIHRLSSQSEGCFGEYEFFKQTARLATVRTVKVTQLAYIQKSDFLQIISKFPLDLEQFQAIMHNLNILDQRAGLDLSCFCCHEYEHNIECCPYVNYKPSFYRIKKEYMMNNEYYQAARLNKYPRKKYKFKKTKNKYNLNYLLYLKSIAQKLIYNQEYEEISSMFGSKVTPLSQNNKHNKKWIINQQLVQDEAFDNDKLSIKGKSELSLSSSGSNDEYSENSFEDVKSEENNNNKKNNNNANSRQMIQEVKSEEEDKDKSDREISPRQQRNMLNQLNGQQKSEMSTADQEGTLRKQKNSLKEQNSRRPTILKFEYQENYVNIQKNAEQDQILKIIDLDINDNDINNNKNNFNNFQHQNSLDINSLNLIKLNSVKIEDNQQNTQKILINTIDLDNLDYENNINDINSNQSNKQQTENQETNSQKSQTTFSKFKLQSKKTSDFNKKKKKKVLTIQSKVIQLQIHREEHRNSGFLLPIQQSMLYIKPTEFSNKQLHHQQPPSTLLNPNFNFNNKLKESIQINNTLLQVVPVNENTQSMNSMINSSQNILTSQLNYHNSELYKEFDQIKNYTVFLPHNNLENISKLLEKQRNKNLNFKELKKKRKKKVQENKKNLDELFTLKKK